MPHKILPHNMLHAVLSSLCRGRPPALVFLPGMGSPESISVECPHQAGPSLHAPYHTGAHEMLNRLLYL